mmetsp:Transcript_10441/g.13817  ORF Transcript_10441/g.13817 Transcript_10441/m.13817 type:complete len:215 (+) Transcript_10441:119-763(+)
MGFLANGIACLGPSTFVSLAFCLGLVATASCSFVRLDDDNFLRVSRIDGAGFGSVGFWCYRQVNSDSRYDYPSLVEDVWDDKFEAARALGMTANCLGFAIWLIYLCAGCMRFPPTVFLAVGCLCFLACLFEGLKFMIFKSSFFCDGDNRGCELDTGGRCSICAIVFWFVAWCMTMAHVKERMDADKDEDGEDASAGEVEEEAPAGGNDAEKGGD